MTGRKDRERVALDRLVDALVDDILNTSDEDILAELKAEAIDPERHAADMHGLFEKAVISANKAKLAAAKAAVTADQAPALRAAPALVDMAAARERLRKIKAASPTLTLAARNETEMTDSDVLGMLEDLKDLGVLPPDGEA